MSQHVLEWVNCRWQILLTNNCYEQQTTVMNKKKILQRQIKIICLNGGIIIKGQNSKTDVWQTLYHRHKPLQIKMDQSNEGTLTKGHIFILSMIPKTPLARFWQNKSGWHTLVYFKSTAEPCGIVKIKGEVFYRENMAYIGCLCQTWRIKQCKSTQMRWTHLKSTYNCILLWNCIFIIKLDLEH